MDFDEAYDDTSTNVGLAARMGYKDFLQELIRKGNPTNGHDNRGWRPLHEAAEGGHVDCLQILLTADDVDVDALTHECTTALQLACLDGSNHTRIVKLLLSAGADPNMATGDEWCLPLPKAVSNNNIGTVKLLLDAGADPNRMDFKCGTPLHVAAEQVLLEVAEVLLERGAEVDRRDDVGRTALHILVMLPRFKQATILPFMNLLIDKGCDVNARMTDGTSPLMLAVQSNLEDAVMRLLECGADPNNMKVDGVMALHFAIEFCPDMEKLSDDRSNSDDQEEHSPMLKKILDLTAKDLIIPYSLQPIKYSIFHLAVEWDRFSTLKMLIANGLPPDSFLQETANAALDEADVNLFRQVPLVIGLGTEVDTPLSFLLSKSLNSRRVEMAKYMIDKGSNVNPVTPNCLPPIVAAVKHQRASYDQKCPGLDILEYLLENGVDVLHKIRKTDVLPAALQVSSLFNVNAFFALLQRCIPTHKIYTRETLERLSQHYSSSLYYTIYPLFPWRVISWLNVLNYFVPQLPLDTKIMFDIGRMVEDVNLSTAWNKLDSLISSPKTLEQLCVLAVRRAVGESKGWDQLSSSLKSLRFMDAPLPPLIRDRLQFKQIETVSLYQCPPHSAMPSYLLPESPSYNTGSESEDDYVVTDDEDEGALPIYEVNNSEEDSSDGSRVEETSNSDQSDNDENIMEGVNEDQKTGDKCSEKMGDSTTDEEEETRDKNSFSSSQIKGKTKRKRLKSDS